MKFTTTASVRRGSCTGARTRRRLPVVFFTALVLCLSANALEVYQITGNVSGGVDLTAMAGYYADRIEGPSGDHAFFTGPLTVDPTISTSNPFRLIGRGKALHINENASGFHSLPLMLYNADGVTAKSALDFYKGGQFSGSTLDVGALQLLRFYSYDYWLASDQVFVHGGGYLEGYKGLTFGLNNAISISVVGESAANKSVITSSDYLRFGFQNAAADSPIYAFVGITNATVTCNASDISSYGKALTLMYGANTADSTTENCRIVIGIGATVVAKVISHHGGGLSNIMFDGGTLTSDSSDSALPVFHTYGLTYSGGWPSPVMNIQGINGNPVDVEIAHDRNLAGIRDGSASSINITGGGGFTKRGAGTLYFNRTRYSVCDYTGPTTILGGNIVVTNDVFKPGRGALALEAGTFLDLNGFDVGFSDTSGAGVVTNGADSASVLTLGYGNANGTFSATVGERISIVKVGTGTLTVSDNALANGCNLTIEGGTVVFAGDSLSYGTVTVKPGATLDYTGYSFSCANLVKERGGTVLPKKGLVLLLR